MNSIHTTATYGYSKDGHLENFGINEHSYFMYGRSRHEIVNVELEEVESDTDGDVYYGFKEFGSDKPTLIYKQLIQTEVCFPSKDYMNSKGEIKRYRVKSISNDKVVFRVHAFTYRLHIISYLMMYHKLIHRSDLLDGMGSKYSRCDVIVLKSEVRNFLHKLNNTYDCHGIIPLTQLNQFSVKCMNCNHELDIPNDYLTDVDHDYKIGYLFQCKSDEDCGTQLDTIIELK